MIATVKLALDADKVVLITDAFNLTERDIIAKNMLGKLNEMDVLEIEALPKIYKKVDYIQFTNLHGVVNTDTGELMIDSILDYIDAEKSICNVPNNKVNININKDTNNHMQMELGVRKVKRAMEESWEHNNCKTIELKDSCFKVNRLAFLLIHNWVKLNPLETRMNGTKEVLEYYTKKALEFEVELNNHFDNKLKVYPYGNGTGFRIYNKSYTFKHHPEIDKEELSDWISQYKSLVKNAEDARGVVIGINDNVYMHMNSSKELGIYDSGKYKKMCISTLLRDIRLMEHRDVVDILNDADVDVSKLYYKYEDREAYKKHKLDNIKKIYKYSRYCKNDSTRAIKCIDDLISFIELIEKRNCLVIEITEHNLDIAIDKNMSTDEAVEMIKEIFNEIGWTNCIDFISIIQLNETHGLFYICEDDIVYSKIADIRH